MAIKRFCFTILCLLIFTGGISAQQPYPKDDTSAIYVLKRMSTTLQNITSCKFTVYLNYDILNDDLGMVKHTDEEKVWMQFPNKFLINAEGDRGKNILLCDGKNFYHYSLTMNKYAMTKASSSIIKTMDTAHSVLGIDFPAADFFYPSFVDDVLQTGGKLMNLGLTKVFGKDCFHIAGKDIEGTSFQFWIANDEYFLPTRMVITYPQQKGNNQYEAYYCDWEINNIFPASLFEFMPPLRSTKIEFSNVSQNQ